MSFESLSQAWVASSPRRLVILVVVVVVVVVVVYFILSRLLYLALSAKLGLLCMPHPRHGTPSLTSLPKDGGVSCFGRSSGGHPSSFWPYTAMLNFS